ncbi:DUF6185 family protein [Lentzea sp. NPDC051838]|uniref:DUF6185 family protein n=1 Tax=Lentzea sp. NPDC051838 TaxID=3154849 RepID=UPI00342F80CB
MASLLLLLLTFFAIAIGVPLGWNALSGPAGYGPNGCATKSFERVTVRAEIKIVSEGRTYPRLTSDLTVRIPTSNAGAEKLLNHEADPDRRALLACLLHNTRSASETRENTTRIDYDNEVVEVTDQVGADLNGPGVFWAGTTYVRVDEDRWFLAVEPPDGLLRMADWDVTVSAPAGWLASPQPWQSVSARPDSLRWSSLTPAIDGGARVVTASLQPDDEVVAAFAVTKPPGSFISLGFSTVSPLLGILLALYLLRRERRGAPSAGVAIRAVWPLVVLFAVTGAGDVFITIVHNNKSIDWMFVHWWFNIAEVLALLKLATVWWLPRAFARLVGLGMALFLVLRAHSGAGPLYLTAFEIGFALLSTFLFLAATGKAFERLLGRGRPHDLPVWLLVTSCAAAAVLTVERYTIAWWNVGQREWLGWLETVAVDDSYRRHSWYLLVEGKWLPLGLTSAALWYFIRRRKYAPVDDRALVMALALLAVGTVWWDIVVLGWTVPVWPLTWGLLALAGAVMKAGKVSVLGKGDDVDLAELRADATRWYAEPNDSNGPTPVDVLLAAGPAGRPLGNMTTAVRLGLTAAALAGAGLIVMLYVAYPLLTLEIRGSVLMRIVTDVEWEAIKWVTAIAATGLAWQHLPGRRGVLKVLPIIFLYSVGPGLNGGAALLVGNNDWRSLVQAALFALVLVIVGVRMDKASLDGVTIGKGSRLQRFFGLYGLENLSAKLTAFLTPLLAVFAIWSAITGGDMSPPSNEPPRPNPAEQHTGKG